MIVLKALAKDKKSRYASVEALGADVRRHLGGEPIEARKATAYTRALRWAARRAVLKKRMSRPAGLAKLVLSKWPVRGLLAKKMREETKKKAREAHYPAPFRLIDLFEAHGGDLEALKALR